MTRSETDRQDQQYWRSYGAAWRAPTAAFVLGIILGLGLLVWLDARRIVPDEVGLGVENWAAPATYNGQRINVWRLDEYAKIYPIAPPQSPAEVLWVGNSQLHAINQLNRTRDHVAAYHASQKLDQPVFCLSLPNGNVQEQLVTLQWALDRRPVRWFVLPMVFDKLRNDGLRPGFELLASPQLAEQLAARPAGRRMNAEMATLSIAAKASDSAQSTRPETQQANATWRDWLQSVSLQAISERALDQALTRHWGLWERRSLLWATILNDAYEMRNWALNIKSTTKRPMLPLPFENNMQAFTELLDVADASNVNVLVYIAPIRQDVEPPYIMAEYLPWKAKVERMVAARRGVSKARIAFADLDKLVPARLWGTVEDSGAIDFMHFQGRAHALLGAKVAELLIEMGMTPHNPTALDDAGAAPHTVVKGQP